MQKKNKFILTFILFCSIAVSFAQETYLYNDDGTSRLHLFEVEQVAFLSSQQNYVTAVEADGKFSRYKYDENMHLLSKVVWKDNQNEPIISSVTDYFYVAGYETPSSSVQQTYYENGTLKTVVRTEYNSFFKPISEAFYSFPLQTQDKELGEEKFNFQDSSRLIEEIFYTYNTKNLLTEKKNISYTEGKISVSKTIYQTPGNERGGYEYYFEDVLQKKISYSEEGDYTETVYFSGGQSIVAVYIDDCLVEEIYYMNEKELRRTKY
ncbi:MAG: hypothetical protein J6B81_04270 [Spirochaetaceae bacterium]|nr:hypothetical protein [Spirochaetaceae bacterium]